MRKHFDVIALAITALTVAVAIAFANGERLGITTVVDADSEGHSDDSYFTDNDLNGAWDAADATYITLEGSSATVTGGGAYVWDGNVTIGASGTYVVSGTLDDGSLVVDANDNSKVWILLDGVDITCSDDACIAVDQADKVFLTLADGSTNTLKSGETMSEDALADNTDGAIFAHDDLTINGTGSLTIEAGYKHGVSANDDLVITGGTITVSAPKDGLHANDSLRICGATLDVTAEDDGLAVDNEGGYLYVESGQMHVQAADEGMVAAGDVTIAGGSIEIATGTEQGHHGIKSDGTCTISGGTVLVSECYEGIAALYIDVMGGDVTVYPADDGLNASTGDSADGFGMGAGMGGPGGGMGGPGGNMGAQNGMDNANDSAAEGQDALGDGEQPQGGPQGGFGQGESGADADATQGEPPQGRPQGGFGQGGPGQENAAQGNAAQAESAQADAAPANGEPAANAESAPANGEPATADRSADADSQDTELPWIHVSGGTITVVNETGNDADGLDSNGDIIITGGDIRVSMLGNGSNNAIDYGSGSGGVCQINGGTVVACGSSAMAESIDASSAQCSLMYGLGEGAEAGATVSLVDASGTTLLSYVVPCSFTSVILSCPQMVVGETYSVVVGDSSESVSLSEVATSAGQVQGAMGGGGFGQGGRQSRQQQGEQQGDTTDQSQQGDATDQQQGDAADQQGDTANQPQQQQNGAGGQQERPQHMGTQPGAETPESIDDSVSADIDVAQSEAYTTETLVLCGVSVVLLAVGIGIARAFRRH